MKQKKEQGEMPQGESAPICWPSPTVNGLMEIAEPELCKASHAGPVPAATPASGLSHSPSCGASEEEPALMPQVAAPRCPFPQTEHFST